MIALAFSAVAVVATAFASGYALGVVHQRHRASAEQALVEMERQRRIHDTKRVSVARPGSVPGRVSRASIDMGSSNMTQSSSEVQES